MQARSRIICIEGPWLSVRIRVANPSAHARELVGYGVHISTAAGLAADGHEDLTRHVEGERPYVIVRALSRSIHVHVEETGILELDFYDDVIVQIVPVRTLESMGPNLHIQPQIRRKCGFIHRMLPARAIDPVRFDAVLSGCVACPVQSRFVRQHRVVGIGARGTR